MKQLAGAQSKLTHIAYCREIYCKMVLELRRLASMNVKPKPMKEPRDTVSIALHTAP